MKKLNGSYSLSIAAKLLFLGVASFLSMRCPSVQGSQSVTLAWDRSPDTTVAGYKVYYSQVGGGAATAIDVGNATTNSVSGLLEGETYSFYLTAYNSSRVEGDPSNAITYSVPATLNSPPTISSIADQFTTQNTTSASVTFIVGDAETAAGSLAVSGASSNPTLVPLANIVFGGSGANRTVSVAPALNQTGTTTITVTVTDGSANATENFVLTVNPAGPFVPVFLPVEAEFGAVASPMATSSNPNASGGKYVVSTIDEAGTVTFPVDITIAGEYVVWCRVLSPDSATDSFYVSMDGGPEDIYDTVKSATYASAWQWTVVNGRNSGLDPRPFQLGTGRHNLVFRGREARTALDQILVTNDRNYVPDIVFSITAPSLKISAITLDPAGSVTLTWPAASGKTYRVAYKTQLTDPDWTSLEPDVTSTGDIASRSDYVVGNRFYRVIELPE